MILYFKKILIRSSPFFRTKRLTDAIKIITRVFNLISNRDTSTCELSTEPIKISGLINQTDLYVRINLGGDKRALIGELRSSIGASAMDIHGRSISSRAIRKDFSKKPIRFDSGPSRVQIARDENVAIFTYT